MKIKGYLYLFAGMAVVGVYVALSKPLTQAFPVFLLAFLRFLIAAVLMLPWLKHSVNPDQPTLPLNRSEKTTLFWQSFFGNFLFSIFMLYGVSQTSATASGVILATLPAVVAALSWYLLKERLTPLVWAAVMLAIVGVALMSIFAGNKNVASGMSLTGNSLVFCCVVCEAVYIILGKRLTQSLSAQRISALINLIGLAIMAPFGIWQAASFNFEVVSVGLWALLVFYAIAASILSTALWLTGLKTVPAAHSGVFTIALPISATLVGILFLGESFNWVHAVSFGCACAGILLIATSGAKKRANSNIDV
jgi:drug/metabolite transporter (DMT)-like permease